jgi:aromatic-L-amino-acid decarboxylase
VVDRSETGGLAAHLAAVGVALDEFLARTGVDPVDTREAWTKALGGDVPEHGAGAKATIDEIIDVLIPSGARMAEPGFWGWITAGPDTVPTVAQVAASVASPQRYSTTGFNLVEDVSLRWLAQLCGLGEHMLGVYSSGGSTANLVALGAARQWAFEQRGRDVAAEGLDPTPMAVYASAEVHHTVQRSAAVLGIGRARVRLIDTDDHQRMRPDALRAALEADRTAGVVPVAVVATTGTTNTGAIDPLREIGELAHEFGAWFHVDGAYGLLGSLDPRVAPLYDGLELADSAIVDPHKWLGAPVGVAATFVRDRSILFRAFTQEPAAYLEAIASGDGTDIRSSLEFMGVPYADFGVELSSPARGAVVWSIVRELGRDGVAERIRRDNDHARRVAHEAHADPRLEVLSEPTLSIVCFRYVGQPGADRGDVDLDDVNTEILRRLYLQTPYVPSSTRVGGHIALRPCFINARTHDEHVTGFTAAVSRLGDQITAG